MRWSPEALELNSRGDELSRDRDFARAHDTYLAAYRAMPDPIYYHLARDSVFAGMRSSLYSLYEETGEVKYLCQVRRILLEHWEALIIAFGDDVKIPDEPGIRRRLKEVDEDMRAHVPKLGEKECVVATPADGAGPMSPGGTRAAGPPTPHEAARAERGPGTETAPERASGAEPGPAASPAAPSQTDRMRRARIGGGAALLVAGGGFVGGIVGALVRRGALTQDLRDLETTIEREGRDATSAEYARAGQLNHSYGALTIVAGACGAAALGSIIGGAVLLSKRPRKVVVALPWSGPHTAGLTLQGRF